MSQRWHARQFTWNAVQVSGWQKKRSALVEVGRTRRQRVRNGATPRSTFAEMFGPRIQLPIRRASVRLIRVIFESSVNCQSGGGVLKATGER